MPLLVVVVVVVVVVVDHARHSAQRVVITIRVARANHSYISPSPPTLPLSPTKEISLP